MRSSCVAFCLFAIYISSSSYASTIAPRDGKISYPNPSLEKVDSQSSSYPTESSSEGQSNTPAGGSTPLPQSKPEENASDYPSESSSEPPQPKEQAPTSSSHGPAVSPAGGNQPQQNTTAPAPSTEGMNTGSPSPPAQLGSTGQSMQCDAYIDGNTTRANCGGEGSKVYCSSCTGGVVAQLCQLNETSPTSTETCTIAYREDSATIHVCINAAGSFSCKGPASGALNCNGCSGCNGCSSSPDTNNTSGSEQPSSSDGQPSPSPGSPNATTPAPAGGDNGNSGAFLSPFNAFLTSAFTVVGGVLLL